MEKISYSSIRNSKNLLLPVNFKQKKVEPYQGYQPGIHIERKRSTKNEQKIYRIDINSNGWHGPVSRLSESPQTRQNLDKAD